MSNKKELYERRPTSPHLSVYRPQITSTLSIMHRLTGVALFFSLSVLTWCLIMQFTCSYHENLLPNLVSDYKIIQLALLGISYAVIYHFCTGLRHLVWDAGRGYSICCVRKSGWLIIILSITLTILFWGMIL